ncbi:MULTISPECIES: TetR/AcrR family transcriptional regulator [unclassified Streptomyces]|uniref:TetR/AcrR family transcriptional regulator n=1 Tax=unclassified Streptomyces TaxID=2593676 RepID=UPI0025538ECA|nr:MULTISPECIES: TetR/AcrR family transcriptional regulator [unclassified Streptomyces]WRZ66913.1 TetR/AcrR family transcriptional regulator [Streptomyces sp. NBC_01257]
MSMSTARTPARTPDRPMRADARRNYDRLLTEARGAFAEHGTDASLEDVARRAGVGIGTLYRHFPTRHALMSAVFQEAVASLIARSRELADAEQPCTGLVEWLGALITHAGEYHGLAQALMSTCRDETSALSPCNVPLREAGSVLLARAQLSGSVRADVSIDDLMQLTKAIALAAEQSPDDPGLPGRLLSLTLLGLSTSGPSSPSGSSSPSGD